MRANARLVVVLFGIGALSGCGTRRPPNVARPGGAPPPAATEETSPVPRPAEEGPGLLGVSPDDVRSTGSPESGGPSARPPGGDGLADVHFAYDQADLTPEAQAILQGHAAWLHGNPGVGLVIEGHCDERGTVEYNLALGARRAEAAREFLAALGIEPSRMRTVSYGKERPLETGGDEAAWARNRRAHFVPER